MPAILADRGEIQSAILNLVNNAVDAITDARVGGQVWLRTSWDGDRVHLDVADDGPGIDPRVADRVFDPFVTTKEPGKGTGLGLSVCHSVVTAHGGRVWFDSAPGRGMTFHVELPPAPAGTKASAHAGASAKVQRGHGCILVVDDEPPIRRFVAEALESSGYVVTLAADGAEAVDAAALRQPDLVLMDLRMPRMDGKEAFAALERDDPETALRVVFMTGDSVSADTRAFLEQAGRPVLLKPFGPDSVLQVVAEHLRTRLLTARPEPPRSSATA